jgi:hypothetical protein
VWMPTSTPSDTNSRTEIDERFTMHWRPESIVED